MNAPQQPNLFEEARRQGKLAPVESPVLIAYGGGVDSTAMILEMLSRGERIDQVLMANTVAEQQKTIDNALAFGRYLESRGVPFELLEYKVKNFKNWPPYRGLYENCLVNGTLPSISFHRHSCSQKWKIAVQDKWCDNWDKAQAAWSQGILVEKCIGYDCSPQDQRRYAEREGHVSTKYRYRYPLREWGWTREDCIARIEREGLGIPFAKSSCFMCAAMKVHEVESLPPVLLRRIILLEARAHPRLRGIEGLWSRTVKGMRGAQARPGSMTQFIRDRKLLPEAEIDLIWNEAPKALIRWQEGQAALPVEQRTPISEWLAFFDKYGDMFEGEGAEPLFGGRFIQAQMDAAA